MNEPDPLAFLGLMLQHFGPGNERADQALDLDRQQLQQNKKNYRVERGHRSALTDSINDQNDFSSSTRSDREQVGRNNAQISEMEMMKAFSEFQQQHPYAAAMHGEQYPQTANLFRPVPALQAEEAQAMLRGPQDGQLDEMQQQIAMMHPMFQQILNTQMQANQPIE